MQAAPLGLLVFLVSLGLVASAQQPPLSTPSFRSGVELVSLNVTVADAQQRYATDLQQDEFQVFEDGVKQDVTFFNHSNLPIALALLIDTSASMESRLQTAQEAAAGFARRLRPQDLAEIVDFDSRVIVLQPFTNGVADLEQVAPEREQPFHDPRARLADDLDL